MRILLLAHGPSIHTRRWAEALRARGHEIRVLTAYPAENLTVPARVVGSPLPIHALRYLSALGAVRSELRAMKPDVTVAHFLPNYGLLAALAPARPFALACWGSDLLVNAWRSPLHRARARYVLRRAALIHVDARVLGEAAAALGAPAERIWTKAWGVDEEMLAAKPEDRAPRAAGGPVRILWTRMLEPIYDPGTFLRALGILKRQGVAFHASIAGDGPMRAGLTRMAREEGIESFVRFEGFVPAARLRALLLEADLYVSLSLSDSTSQSLLEAMAAGAFPIVSDIAGNREWVTHRREGYLVPTGDADAVACAIAEARRDPSAAAIMGRARAAVLARGRFADTVAELEQRLLALVRGAGGR